jgi:hypothetical protein
VRAGAERFAFGANFARDLLLGNLRLDNTRRSFAKQQLLRLERSRESAFFARVLIHWCPQPRHLSKKRFS